MATCSQLAVLALAAVATALATSGFLLESLGVGHTIPHHHNCILATFPQLGVMHFVQ